jgi:hypothetical protein
MAPEAITATRCNNWVVELSIREDYWRWQIVVVVAVVAGACTIAAAVERHALSSTWIRRHQ